MKFLHELITALLLSCSLGTFAYEQEYIYTSKFFPASVQSPQASDLGKYGELSVSHYTGRANVTIKEEDLPKGIYIVNGKKMLMK